MQDNGWDNDNVIGDNFIKYIRHSYDDISKQKDMYYNSYKSTKVDEQKMIDDVFKTIMAKEYKTRLVNKREESSIKCKVDGCTNHSDQGQFEGEVCKPCYMFLCELNNFILQKKRQHRCAALNTFKLLTEDYMS